MECIASMVGGVPTVLLWGRKVPTKLPFYWMVGSRLLCCCYQATIWLPTRLLYGRYIPTRLLLLDDTGSLSYWMIESLG